MDYLNKDELAAVLKKAKSPRRTSRPRKNAENYRTYESWFKGMKQFAGTCSNPNCIDPRPRTTHPSTMVAELSNGETVCRFCFLDGYGKKEANEGS